MSKPELILLALEDSAILNLMERALLSGKFETAIARDIQSLGKILQESVPGLLMIGENFDGRDGLTIARELLERFPTIPVLIYANQARPELIKGVLRLGLSGFLVPPLRTSDIVDSVETSLKNAHRMGDWLRREVKRTTASLQKRAQISESERSRLESVFLNIHDCVMLLDQQNHIILINPAMCRAFGLDEKAVLGKPVLDVVSHPDLRSLLTRTDHNDPLQYHEVSFADGRVGNAQLTVIHDVGFALTMQDITYLKEMDRIRSEFVHTVSHDLRSPLTSVIGYTELVERAGSLNDLQRDFLNRIQDSGQQITALINDLLDIGSIEAGFDTRREFVQLEGILRYTLDILQGQVKSKRLVIKTDISPSLPPLRANPIRLRQVMDNVVGNAIKYSRQNGEIEISIRAEGEQLILKVTDNGPGIPISDQPRIFDKFYRGSNVDADVEGSGLGLAIVKTIVESHQGRIWVESVEGKGSSFFIVLPVLSEPATVGKK
jgi:PAS domain S-box-containing protein